VSCADESCERCWYCDVWLTPSHEHDHPVPQRHGGEWTVPICWSCHDIKDRLDMREWSADMLVEGLLSILPGPGRLLFFRMYAMMLDAHKKFAEQRPVPPPRAVTPPTSFYRQRRVRKDAAHG
jgi:hypothetical protein